MHVPVKDGVLSVTSHNMTDVEVYLSKDGLPTKSHYDLYQKHYTVKMFLAIPGEFQIVAVKNSDEQSSVTVTVSVANRYMSDFYKFWALVLFSVLLVILLFANTAYLFNELREKKVNNENDENSVELIQN